jgi:hypothetical protein
LLILRVVGLRPKMYSLLHVDNQEKLTAKGVKTSYVKSHIRQATYAQCLNCCNSTSATYQVLRSRSHIIRTETITKHLRMDIVELENTKQLGKCLNLLGTLKLIISYSVTVGLGM